MNIIKKNVIGEHVYVHVYNLFVCLFLENTDQYNYTENN